MNKQFVGFCVKSVLFFGLIAVVDFGVGYAFTLLKDEGLRRNPENQWLKTPYAIELAESDLLIIGSSKSSHHYVPKILSDELGMSVYNCGQDGCFFLYQNCIVNIILDRYTPSAIIWDIQPECLVDNSATKEYQNIRYLSPYYYDNKWVKDYVDGESSTMGTKMRSKMFAYNSKVLNYLIPLVQRESSTDKGYIPLYSSDSDNVEYLSSGASDYLSDQNKLQHFSDTVSRCAECGVELIVLVSPQFIDMSSYSVVIEDIRSTVEDQNGFFRDYSMIFDNNKEYFKDASHMNDTGARVYTEMLCEQLNL